jgi:hypothetical protein
MSPRTQQEILQQILSEQGLAGWSVFEESSHSTREDLASSWMLFNFRMRRAAKVVIPIVWLSDRRRDNAIGELIRVTINNCSHPVLLSKIRKFRMQARSKAVAA